MTDPFDPRAALLRDRQRAQARLADLTGDYAGIVEASRDSNADDEHDPEGSTIAFERSQIDALIGQAQHHLDDVEDAEARLRAGTYGTCEECGTPIGEARLEARPTARVCIACASSNRRHPPSD